MDTAAWFEEGNRQLENGALDAAASCFRTAIRLQPEAAEAYGNLGYVLDRQGELAQAETCYRQSLALAPACPEIQLNLGALLAGQRRFAEARAAYRRAWRLRPDSPAVWSNLGALYLGLKREERAEACLRRALELDETYAKARFNLAYLLLRQERFAEGWASLEARTGYQALARYLDCPRWQGEPLAGKSVLIGYEAGHGDMIQFGRYAKVLKARGAARVTLLCHPALKRLFAGLAGVDALIPFDEAVPRSGWDVWTPLLSLPFHCRTRAGTLPAQLPYLHAPPGLTASWRARLPRGGLRVGLAWKGNPRFENDAARSLPGLATLAPLGSVAGVSFVSLQKGAGENEAAHPPPGLALLDLGSRMQDFADAAAIVAGLDLVISVDTAMAHLAGALGTPCWVLLPDYLTDWRWGRAGESSAWYPGVMRLFRQRRADDWGGVVAELAAALRALVASAATPRQSRSC